MGCVCGGNGQCTLMPELPLVDMRPQRSSHGDDPTHTRAQTGVSRLGEVWPCSSCIPMLVVRCMYQACIFKVGAT